MSIADIINGTGSSTAKSGRVAKKDELGQGQFLELMIAQLKNQDPFKAMDPSQFLGQLAQFGTVTGIQEMQGAFATLSDSLRATQVLGGSSMVGREVLVAADKATLGEQGSIQGALDVPAGVTSLELNVRDASGQLVRRVQLPTAEGLNEFTWDGIAGDGTRAAAGRYTLEAVASSGGKNASLQTLLSDRVTSVTIDSGNGLVLNTRGLGAYALR